MSTAAASEYDARPGRGDVRPQVRPLRLVLSLLITSASLFVAAAILPGFDITDFWTALLTAIVVGLLNAILAPIVAALRLPYTVATSFLLLLVLNALLLRADGMSEGAVEVGGFGSGLIAALVISAVSTALEVVAGTNDDDVYMIRVIQRIAGRSGERIQTDVPGALFLEIDGLSPPMFQRALAAVRPTGVGIPGAARARMPTGRLHSTTPPRSKKAAITQTTTETLVRHAESAAFAPDDHAKLTGRLEASMAT